jgi:glycosyltransferase involved in cell wall biosynthesis
VAELMAAANLFVHPAKVESYGLVLEEAQACGTPVLAFAGGGVNETLENGATGWLLPKYSSEILSSTLKQVLAKPADLEKLRQPSRNLMEQKHGPNEFQKRWNELVVLTGLFPG